uniref:CSTF_C domain-containing protein n=1 Tax=Heterorhabditis bacteriophora TaxID=37862 RepID=A0A1I7WSG7_HETBA
MMRRTTLTHLVRKIVFGFISLSDSNSFLFQLECFYIIFFIGDVVFDVFLTVSKFRCYFNSLMCCLFFLIICSRLLLQYHHPISRCLPEISADEQHNAELLVQVLRLTEAEIALLPADDREKVLRGAKLMELTWCEDVYLLPDVSESVKGTEVLQDMVDYFGVVSFIH